MQAYFASEQAFAISILQPVFENLIAYKKDMYAVPTVIFAHYKHRRWKTIKVFHYHSAQFLPASPFIPISRLLTLEIFANFPVYCTLAVYYFGRNLLVSPVVPPSLSIWNSRVALYWTDSNFLQKDSLKVSSRITSP